MSNASTTPAMRCHGWNVHLVATSNAFHFAGLYQDPDNGFLTFRDLVDELRLCFEDDGNWEGVAFGLDDQSHDANNFPLFVTTAKLDTVIPSFPSPDRQRRAVVRYHIVRHTECQLDENSPLSAHLEASCASHISRPTRRYDPRYLSPKATSSKKQITQMPLRRNRYPKRKHSSLTSRDEEVDDASEIIAPGLDNIDKASMRRVMNSFRSAVMVAANECAVTGKGQSWCVNPGIGPALQACHIIPQQHFNVYPTGDNTQDTDCSELRLAQAWYNTWSPKNGLLLMSHIHELFDSRLFSIHPKTHRIRAFVPYDVLLDYHGHIARIPAGVDANALAHHYEMTCIKNMAAQMSTLELSTLPSRTTTSGTSTPLTAGSDLPGVEAMGNPTKRARTQIDGKGPDSGAQDNDGRDASQHRVAEWVNQGYCDNYITPANSQRFLADVNFELGKLI